MRFFLDFLRPEETDPRYFGLTFAQYASILAFGAAIYAATRVAKHGEVVEPMRRTSGEVARELKMTLKEETATESETKDDAAQEPADDKEAAAEKKPQPKKAGGKKKR